MKNLKSCLALVIIGIVYCVSLWSYKPYKVFYGQKNGDSPEYYLYLPSFFIYHDLADMHATQIARYSHAAPSEKAPDKTQDKYFIGSAVLQAPFFLVAHVLAPYLHQPQDGFSRVYMYAVQWSNTVYAWLALLILLFVLRRRFSDSVVAIVLLLIGLGTNLYFLAVAQPLLSHCYLLFWYSLILYFTIRFYETERRLYMFLIGLAYGMIILTRLNELYAILIPMLWGLKNPEDVKERWLLVKRNVVAVSLSAAIAVLCLVPQILYWKISSGHYLLYSYQGESFDFLHPHIWGGLLGWGNGWLIYSPIMFLALAGFWFLFRKKDPSFTPAILFIPIHIYIIYSWWCWYYMGSYGSRPMTETYALLSIPMAYAVEWFWEKLWRRIILVIIGAFCIWVVMIQTYQSHKGFFDSEISNWRFNLVTLGKSNITYEESIVLDTKEIQPRYPVFVKLLKTNDFEDPQWSGTDTTASFSGRRSVCVKKDSGCMIYETTLKQGGFHKGQWIKASVHCMTREATNSIWHLSGMVIMYTRKGNTGNKWTSLGLQNKIDNPEHQIWHYPTNQWGEVYFYSEVPNDMTDGDQVRVYIEHRFGPDIYIDDAKVELYEEK